MELEARAVPLRTLPSELVRILPHHSLRGFAKGLAGSCAFSPKIPTILYCQSIN